MKDRAIRTVPDSQQPTAGRVGGQRDLLRGSELARRLAGPVAVALAAAVMLAWTWRTWPDVFIDSGVQVYVPWRLSAGEVLYRDLAYYNGPLSPYVNAVWFRIFGTSMTTYFWSNGVTLAVFLVLAWTALRCVAGRVATTLALLVFVLLFAFAQFDFVSGYNWMAPYAAEGTHGLTLGLASLLAMWRFERGRTAWSFASGLLLGLTVLTKAEIALGAIGAVVLALGMILADPSTSWGRRLAAVALFAAGCLLPAATATALFSAAMPPSQAAAGTAGSWKLLFNDDVNSLVFHRLNMGLVNPPEQLRRLVLASFFWVAFLVPGVVGGLLLKHQRGAAANAACGALFVAAFVAAFGLRNQIPWLEIARPLTPAMLILALAMLGRWFRTPRAGEEGRQLLYRATLCVWGLGLLAKIVLNCHIYHYGFLHAVPATLVAIAAFWDWLPAAVAKRGGNGLAVRCAVLPPLFVGVAFYLTLTSTRLATYNVQVAQGSDAFWSNARGKYMNAALVEVAKRVPEKATLSSLPAGTMLNYLSRRRTSVPYLHVIPTELGTFGEEVMLAAFQAHPPDWIALVQFDGSEFGQPHFGTDFGVRVYDWIGDHYAPQILLGSPPFKKTDEFGIGLLERRQ